MLFENLNWEILGIPLSGTGGTCDLEASFEADEEEARMIGEVWNEIGASLPYLYAVANIYI
jgi:hypothetical protein